MGLEFEQMKRFLFTVAMAAAVSCAGAVASAGPVLMR